VKTEYDIRTLGRAVLAQALADLLQEVAGNVPMHPESLIYLYLADLAV
jgi:hypothetical protein